MIRPEYGYVSEDGILLSVEPGPGAAGDISSVTVGGDPVCLILAEHRAEVAAGLWTGAGAPAPVILERPDGPADRFQGIKIERDGGSVLLRIGGNREALDAGAARTLAARIAILADEAEDEPDPAEIEELAELLREHGDCASLRWEAARAALRWMRDKQQRGGTAP